MCHVSLFCGACLSRAGLALLLKIPNHPSPPTTMSLPSRISSHFFLNAILNDTSENDADLVDDIDEVKELIGSVSSLSIQREVAPSSSDPGETVRSGLGQQSVARILSAASKAVKDRTDMAYRRYVLLFSVQSAILISGVSLMAAFNKYCIEENFIAPGVNVYKITQLDTETDFWIIAWIMAESVTLSLHDTAIERK